MEAISREPAILFDLYDCIKKEQANFNSNTVTPLLDVISVLGVEEGPRESRPVPAIQLAKASRGAFDGLDSDEDENDDLYCHHHRTWRETPQSITCSTTASEVVPTLRDAIGLMQDAKQNALDLPRKKKQALTVDVKGPFLLEILGDLRAVQECIEWDVLGGLASSLNKVGCWNGCKSVPGHPTVSSRNPTGRRAMPQGVDTHPLHTLVAQVVDHLNRSIAALQLVLSRVQMLHYASPLSEHLEASSEAGDSIDIDMDDLSSNESEADTTPPQPLPLYLIPPEDSSPFTELPEELLVMILVMRKKVDPRSLSILCHVNRDLRDVTLSTAVLWNEFNIMDFIYRTSPLHTQAVVSSLQISLSLPPGDQPDDGTTHLTAFLDTYANILSLTSTLKAVYMDLGLARIAIEFLQEYANRLPNLEVLHVGLINDEKKQVTVNHLDALSTVRDLCVSRICLQSVPPLNQLVKLHVIGCMTPSFYELLQVILRIPHLQDLKLSDIHAKAPIPVDTTKPTAAVSLSGLRKLVLERFGLQEYRLFFQTIAPINLISFTISRPWRMEGGAFIDSTDLMSVLEGCPGIEDISLNDCEPDDFINFYKRVPELKHLRLCLDNLTNANLRPLIRVEQQDCLCPQLRSLEFTNVLSVSSPIVKDIVLSRSQSPSPITSVILQGWDEDNLDDEDMAAMVERGTTVWCSTLDVDSVVHDPNDLTVTTISTEEADLSTGMTSGDLVVAQLGEAADVEMLLNVE